MPEQRVSPSSKTVALFGHFGGGNLGNDGSLEAMLNFLRLARPDDRLLCICDDPEKIQKDFGVTSIGIRRIAGDSKGIEKYIHALPFGRKLLHALHVVRHARQIDVVIAPGTGMLDDFGGSFLGAPASIFSWFLVARIAGAKIAFVSAGAGPINHAISRWLLRSAARLAHFRSYRDATSKHFMKSIGLNTVKDSIYPDLVFGLAAPTGVDRRAAGEPRLTIGVGVMAYYGWSGDPDRGASIYNCYLNKLTRFVLEVLRQDYAIRLLVGDRSDEVAVQDLFERLRAEADPALLSRVTFSPVGSLLQLMRQMCGTDVVVATRFHNIVCALRMEKPCISIGYAQKNDVLMSAAGLDEFCQHIEQLDEKLLLYQLGQLIAGKQEYQQRIAEVVAAFKGELTHQEKSILDSVLA